jgi:lipid A 3-O-deacylase
MSLAFCTFGSGAMLLAQVIPSHLSTRSGRLGRRGLWFIGVALFAAGLFPPIPTRPVLAYVHGVSGLVVILASPIVFLLLSRSLSHEPAWLGTCRHLRWATALAWIGLLLFLGSTVVFAGRASGDPVVSLEPAIGISNRLMIMTYCLWFVVAAWRPARRASSRAVFEATRWAGSRPSTPAAGWTLEAAPPRGVRRTATAREGPGRRQIEHQCPVPVRHLIGQPLRSPGTWRERPEPGRIECDLDWRHDGSQGLECSVWARTKRTRRRAVVSASLFCLLGRIAVCLIGVSVLAATPAGAESIRAGALEWALAAGGGATLGIPAESLETVASFHLLPHLGYFLTGEVGEGIGRGNVEFIVEPTLIHLDASSNSATVIGLAAPLRWVFAASPRLRPYIEAGGGVLGGHVDLQQAKCDVNFVIEGGGGAMLFMSERVALTLGARYHHLSNADRCSKNLGLNSVIGIVGISYIFR